MKIKMLWRLLSFAFLLTSCVDSPLSKTTSAPGTTSNPPTTSSTTPVLSTPTSSSDTPVSSSTSSATSTPANDGSLSANELLYKNGQKAKGKGIIHGIQSDGFCLYDPSGYVYVKIPENNTQGKKGATATWPKEGDYVTAEGEVSLDKGYLELTVSSQADIVVLTESPSYALPAPRVFTAIELSQYLNDTYVSWLQAGGGGDMPGSTSRTPIAVIPFEITCSELLAFPQDGKGLCSALGPGLDFLDFVANFLDSGYAIEKAPYQFSFFALCFGSDYFHFALTGAKKLTPEFPYTTIADLKKNPVRGAHYNIQGKLMGEAFGQYVIDDGTGRVYASDLHLAGEYGQAYKTIGEVYSINGALCETFFECRYEFLSYAISSEITHTPTVSLNTVKNTFPESDYATATDESTPYWVSERFTCSLSYKSGGTSNDPTLRCSYGSLFCVIINHKALGRESYGSSFTFSGYLIYGYKGVGSLLYDSHSEA